MVAATAGEGWNGTVFCDPGDDRQASTASVESPVLSKQLLRFVQSEENKQEKDDAVISWKIMRNSVVWATLPFEMKVARPHRPTRLVPNHMKNTNDPQRSLEHTDYTTNNQGVTVEEEGTHIRATVSCLLLGNHHKRCGMPHATGRTSFWKESGAASCHGQNFFLER